VLADAGSTPATSTKILSEVIHRNLKKPLNSMFKGFFIALSPGFSCVEREMFPVKLPSPIPEICRKQNDGDTIGGDTFSESGGK